MVKFSERFYLRGRAVPISPDGGFIIKDAELGTEFPVHDDGEGTWDP